VSVKASTMAELEEAESLPMGSADKILEDARDYGS
jgi:hypothetical protein